MDKEFDAGPVSIPEPHYVAPDAQNKKNQDYDSENNASGTKETLEEATPKANQSLLPTSSNSDNHSNSLTMQRSSSAAASYHRSRQNIPGTHSTPSAVPTATYESASDNAPMIQVVPSSPLSSTAGSASRHEAPAGSLTSGGEISSRSERRASRHRSEMEVS